MHLLVKGEYELLIFCRTLKQHKVLHRRRSRSGWSGSGWTNFWRFNEIHFKKLCVLCAHLLQPDHFKVLPTLLRYTNTSVLQILHITDITQTHTLTHYTNNKHLQAQTISQEEKETEIWAQETSPADKKKSNNNFIVPYGAVCIRNLNILNRLHVFVLKFYLANVGSTKKSISNKVSR